MVLQYAYCSVSVLPLRKEPSHRSEQVSQLLFGEMVEVLEVDENAWARVRNKWDEYEGWCKFSQIHSTTRKDFGKATKFIVTQGDNRLSSAKGKFWLPVGAELRKSSFEMNGEKFSFKGKKQKIDDLSTSDTIIKSVANQFLYAPYQWGGRTTAGIDCSGFTQIVYKLCGKKIARDASQQASEGESIDFLQNANVGDLAFFDNEDGKINHVGLLLDSQTIIHATDTSGCVVVDKIDQGGIISSRLKKRTHNLRLVRRYF